LGSHYNGENFSMTAMPQPSLTPQHASVSRPSVEKMKIMLDALRVTILNLNLDADAGMQMLAEETMPLAGAVGAAIALKTNDQIVCRASAGQAPGVGAVLQPRQGLSGECVLTGNLVRCDDTDVDSRVNPQICRDLGFRSALIAPITLEGQSIGLVELLAAQPHHFNEDDVLFLNDVAAVVLELNGLKPQNTQVEHAAGLEPDFLAKFDMQDLMSALEHDTAEEAPAAPMPEINDAVLMERLEFIRNGNAAPAAKPQVAVATRVTPRLRTVKEESTESRRQMVWLLVAAVVLLIIGGGIWIWKTRHVAPTSQPANPHASSSPSGTLQKVHETASIGTSGSAIHASEVSSSTRWVERPDATAATSQKRTSTLSPKQGSEVLSGASRERSAADLTPAPLLAGLNAGTSNAPALPPIGEPARPVFQPTKVSSGLRGGTPIYQPRPTYPEMAKRNGLQGDVVLKFMVTKTGTVTNVRVVSGNPTLAQAAIQSVRMWRYRPFLLNDEPTEAESQATIKFTSPR
jgi:TonB family protein